MDDEPCDSTTGVCLNGCADWYAGDDCSYELPRLGMFTPNLQVIRKLVITVNFTHMLLPREGIQYHIQYKPLGTTDWYGYFAGETDTTEFASNYNTRYVVQVVPFDTRLNIYGEPSQEAVITTGCHEKFWGTSCQHQCHCVDDSESCDSTTGKCTSGCNAIYVGVGCQIEKPSLRNATIEITTVGNSLSLAIPADDTLNIQYLVE